MRPIALTPETATVARRILWFEEPEKALSDPVRFLAYAMTYATHEDLKWLHQPVCKPIPPSHLSRLAQEINPSVRSPGHRPTPTPSAGHTGSTPPGF